MNINHLSVSRTQLWHDCRLKYKLKYHLKIVSPEPEQPYFLYGKMVHKIIEEYTRSRGETNINEIRKRCLDGDIVLEEGKNIVPRKVLPAEYINKLPAHLTAFMKLVKKFGFDGETEIEFLYDLDPPNKKCVNGYIDRLIIKNDRALILDYKTTKVGPWRKNKRDIVGDLQLQCYSMVVNDRYGIKPENIKSALVYLDGEELIGASFTQQTLDKCKQGLLAIYNDIEKSNPDKVVGSVNKQCERCEFCTICPALKITR